MKGSRKVKVLFSLFFLTLMVGLTLGYLKLYPKVVDEDVQEQVLGVTDDVGVPYIVSLPPIVAVPGELYEYYVRVVDRDSNIEDLNLEYVSGPNWLELENMVLRGFVPEGSSGSYKIVIRVSDGYNSSTQKEYILVEEVE